MAQAAQKPFAKLFKADGSMLDISPANRQKGFTLEELRAWLECDMIEVIYLRSKTKPSDMIFIGDEEARLVDEPIENPRATNIYRSCWGPRVSNIVGNIIMCPSKWLK